MSLILKAASFAVVIGGLVMPALAQETRTVTDHGGYVVDVPVEPQRIVSLSDWTTTIMAHELGVTPVGSVGRANGDGTYHIRSGRELYDLDFDDMALASVHGELDMELIASLKPDLIVGLQSDTIAYRETLALIAPTLLFDTENGRDPLDNYAEFAGWLSLEDRFNELNSAYEARIAAYLAEHPDRQNLGSYIVMRPNAEDGDITVYRTFGAITTVLDDIGFPHNPMMDAVGATEQRASFSAELIGEMNADYIFAGHMEDRGETAETPRQELETVAPGSSAFLVATQNDRFISLSRFHISPPTFAALHYFLDRLEVVN